MISYLKALEVATIKMYHVSPATNDRSIKRFGLRPQTGSRSTKLNESKGIFLFPSVDDLEDALMNWLGDEFEDDETLTIWEVTIPDKSKLKRSTVGYERIYTDVIPPTNLKFLRRE